MLAKDLDRKSDSQDGACGGEGGQGSRRSDQVDWNMSGVVLPILIIHLMGDLYATHSVSWHSNWSILGANGLSEMRAV